MSEIKELLSNINLDEIVEINFRGTPVQVRQYLPLKDKLDLIQNVVNLCDDKIGIYNPGKVDMYLAIEILFKYTDIDFGETEIEQFPELYDRCTVSYLIPMVFDAIPDTELKTLKNYASEIIKNIHTYSTSVYGMLDMITTEYKNLDLNAEDIRQKLADPETFPVLKEILDKLG